MKQNNLYSTLICSYKFPPVTLDLLSSQYADCGGCSYWRHHHVGLMQVHVVLIDNTCTSSGL